MRIEDVCTVFTDGDWIESKDQSEEGIRLVQTGNIGEGIYLEKEERAKYISEDIFERLKCTEIFPGDILVSRLPEPVGRACIVPDKSERMITAVDCTICRPDEMIISKEYLCYFMRSNAYYTRLLGNVAGTTRKRISRKNLGNIELNVPTKDEQRAVVEQLDCLTKIIDSSNKEISLLDELIKARFVEMFGDPITNEKKFLCKDGKSLFAFSSGKFLDESRRMAEGVPVYGGNGIAWYTDNALIEKPTVVIGRVGAYCGNVRMVTEAAWITDNAIYIKELKTNDFNLNFLYELMQYMNFARFADYSGQPKITQKPLETLDYIVPPINLQNQFAAFVAQTDKSKAVIQKSIDELQILFDSLMQKYFG